MDLRTGNLLWPALTPRRESYPPLDQCLDCEILVVGGGISGAMVAWHLTQAGADVVLVDRRPPAMGSTPASTALVQYEIDVPLVRLRDLVGSRNADRAYQRCCRAVGDMRTLVSQLDDWCDLIPRNSLFLAGEHEGLELLERESAARRESGIDAALLSESQLWSSYGIGRAGAILSSCGLELDPYRLTLAMLRGSSHRGARIFGETTARIRSIGKGEVELSCGNGCRLRACHVVFAMGYETPGQFGAGLCKLKSTYAIATSPVDPAIFWPSRAMIWEHADPYFYLRTTADNRIVAGGEDEPFVDPKLRDSLIERKSATLLKKLKKLFPAIKVEPEYRWAGTFAQTQDGLPFIGRAPDLPRCSFALGYGGNGITFSLIAAQIISGALNGQSDPDAHVFSFARKLAGGDATPNWIGEILKLSTTMP